MISIIMPIYQAEKYLGKSVDSIISQTFADWELWLVDDGSTDDSAALCDRYTAADKRIIALHQKNQGPAAARNNALKRCKGEAVYFADSDDWLEPDMLEVMYGMMKKTGADIVVSEYFEEQPNRTVTRGLANGATKLYSRNEALMKILRDEVSSYLWTKLFKRSLLVEEIPDLRAFEDHAVFFKWASHANTMLLVSKPLYHYRMNPDSILHNADIEQKLCFHKAIDERKTFIEDNGLLADKRDEVNAVYMKNIIKTTKDIARIAAPYSKRREAIRRVFEPVSEEVVDKSRLNAKQLFRLWLLHNCQPLYIRLMSLSSVFITKK